jgi:hypothetical protein
MAQVTLTIPDDVATEYKAGAIPNHSLEQTLSAQLIRFRAVRPFDKFLMVPPAAREALEKLTTQLPITTAEALVAAVRSLAGVEIGHIRLDFTPSQLRELKTKADRWRMTPEQYVEGTVRRLLEDSILAACPRPGEMLAAGAGK